MECFHPYALYWFKKNRPEVIRGQLSEQFLKEKEEGTFTRKIGYFIVKNLLTNFITKPDFIAYHYKYKDCLPLKICRRFYKIPIYGWTFRDKKHIKRMNLILKDLFLKNLCYNQMIMMKYFYDDKGV